MTKLFVYGVNSSCPKDLIEDEFGRCGKVTDVYITGKGNKAQHFFFNNIYNIIFNLVLFTCFINYFCTIFGCLVLIVYNHFAGS